jgi:hypothetical protein
VKSDTGPFAIIPVWILDLPVSDLAIRIYAIHADWTDRKGAHFHTRAQLAERARCTTKSIDRAHRELVGHGALRVEKRFGPSGDHTSNVYWLIRSRSGGGRDTSVATPGTPVSPPGDTGVASGGDTDVPITRRPNEPEEKLTPDAKVRVLAEMRRLRKVVPE